MIQTHRGVASTDLCFGLAADARAGVGAGEDMREKKNKNAQRAAGVMGSTSQVETTNERVAESRSLAHPI